MMRSTATAGAPAKRPRSLQSKMSIHGYVFTAPFLIGFFLIYIFVIFDSFRLSFHNLNLTTDPYTMEFVGLDHYRFALTEEPDFLRNLTGTVAAMMGNIPIIVLFSLFIATLLNHKMIGRTFFRAVFFVPVILATGIVARAEIGNYVMTMVGSGSGVDLGDPAQVGTGMQIVGSLEYYLSTLTFNQDLVGYITMAVRNIYNVVTHSGIQILLFLSGLQSISPSIYESASIEGASGWESFWKITFPMISPTILVNTVYSVIDDFTRSDNPIMRTMQNMHGNEGLGSAMAWIYFVFVSVVLALIFLFVSRFVFYQQKD